MSKRYYWPRINEDTTHFIKAWVKRQVNQTSYQKQGDLVQQLSTPARPWHFMCMNFAGNLSAPQGYDVIFVMVERFAKLAQCVPIVETATALETSYSILKGWWRHHGLPRVIGSNWRLKFTNAFYLYLSTKVGINLRFSMAFHSQTIRKIERVNGFFNQYLRNLVGADQRDWADYVGWAEFGCNVAIHLRTKGSSLVVACGMRSNLLI